MPLFASVTPFDTDVEKATNEMSTTEDWGLILDICEKVQRQPNGARDCLKSIVKRLNHKIPFVSMQALTLLNACVNNCGRPFHLEIASRDFVSECRTLISQKAHPKVAQKLKLMIKTWADMAEFRDDPALNLIPSFYESLRKEGVDFSETEPVSALTTKAATDPSTVRKEEDDIAKAIALSLQEEQHKSNVRTGSSGSGGSSSSGSLYPTYATPVPSQTVLKSVQKEIRKVRALYDFEAAEDNELTFKGGELICVLDDSDPNWWKGSNHRGEGLFPANFVTADLTAEPEPDVKVEKKSVQFSDQVEVKTLSLPPGEEEIDESKIDEVLTLIQNADPTGDINPDSQHMLMLEEQCKAMGPLIDAELEKIDRKHATLVELNKKVMDALQMYHNLMKETPAYGYSGLKTQETPAYGYSGLKTPGNYVLPPGVGGAPNMGPPLQYNNQPQYMLPGGMGGPPSQGPPSMSMAGGMSGPMPSQIYTQTQMVPPSQQSFHGHSNVVSLSGYSTHPSSGAVPNLAAVNGGHSSVPPQQQIYSGGQAYTQGPPSGMYHPPPPQQPLL
ncbi:unnamed protein product [Lymnaea stagnalis]|uniref:Signal transducing adapter molecule 1 n=1 Tax=Lymnaea stagnalis TaxID=6523 RepID=A0AAV2IAC2_LYMST